MKKTILRSALLAVAGVGLLAGSAMATTIYGDYNSDGIIDLQGVLNDITVGGDSSIDVQTDQLGYDETWAITGSGAASSTLIIELAGFADSNIFGVYDNGQYVSLFGGLATAGAQASLSIKLDGSVYVNYSDTGVDFTGNSFGFYLDSSANTGGGLFHSEIAGNTDGLDHMVAYQGTGTDTVGLPNLAPGTWTDNEFILAWEDLVGPYSGGNYWNAGTDSDRDFTDFVVMIESVEPIPEPATMLLFGTGLAGLAGLRRKNSKKA